MEIQLQELIDRIKQDGVEAAESEAASILRSAQEQADKIVADARAQAEKLLQDAKEENARVVRSGEDTLRQAGRNVLLSFRESVVRELEAVVREGIEGVYSSDALAELVTKALATWMEHPDVENLAVIVNTDDLKALETAAVTALKERLKGGVTLKANDNFDGGFRIAVNNGDVYYDYSAQAVAAMLSQYLSPKVAELLREA